MIKCKKHPKYETKLKPRTKCLNCEKIYREKIISNIAQRFLNISAMELKLNRFDFHNSAICDIRSALIEAYVAGQKQGVKKMTIEQILNDYFNISTLKIRDYDRTDFLRVSALSIKQALRAAYIEGLNADSKIKETQKTTDQGG